MIDVILRLMGDILLAVVIAFGIYYVIYTLVINYRIRKGITDGKQLTDFSKIAMLVVIAVLAYMCWDQSRFYNSPAVNTRNSFVSVDVSDPDNPLLGMTNNMEMSDVSYVKVYSDEENPGYEKNVVVDGDYTFTVFTRTAAADAYHPDFLCFVEYSGAATGTLANVKAAFESPDDDGRSWSAGGEATFPRKLLYVGNLDEDCVFVITLSTYWKSSEVRITL